MAKRLQKTTADYVAIAISPALIMALVGSLVYFLIEVLYVGDYQARLNYAFALFVFAAVLIARISIEMGSERAVLFALPLGIAMFLFMVRFIEQPSALSHLINLCLMFVVWWCAHRLTWDSTVINDHEDASGEGLMQQVGVDEGDADNQSQQSTLPAGSKDNELLAAAEQPHSLASRAWSRIIGSRQGPHMPGLWVFYFSLAALPLFGIGQHWVPAAEVGRRRYIFSLLLVYVASAMALLVTTSFLNLRRYLRQRRVEMPLTIAGTWVGVGAVLILVIMFLAALLPRPAAEIAMSRVPWQAGSPAGLSPSRMSMNRDGGEENKDGEDATPGERADEKPSDGDEGQSTPKSESKSDDSSAEKTDGSKSNGEKSDSSEDQATGQAQSENGQSAEQQNGEQKSDSSGSQSQSPEKSSSAEQQQNPSNSEDSTSTSEEKAADAKSRPPSEHAKSESEQSQGQESTAVNNQSLNPATAIQSISTAFGGLAGLLKLLFYVVLALAALYGIWKYRHQILQTLAEILRQLRELFGGKTATASAAEEAAAAARRLPTFAEFRDPFLTGQHSRMPPEELVRYTFAAFEAWSNDRGKPRAIDCTPQELVRRTLAADTPMFASAHRLTRLYSEAAYAPFRIPRDATNELRTLWQQMRDAHADVLIGAG